MVDHPIEAAIKKACSDGNISAPTPDLLVATATNINQHLINSVKRETKTRTKDVLYATDLGKCQRKIWYDVHDPAQQEVLTPSNYIKFLLGNITEEAVLFLVEMGGLKVEGRQEQVIATFDRGQVRGRIDARINNTIVDVKSTSSIGFKKYSTRGVDINDPFDRSYVYQLGFYSHFHSDKIVSPKGEFLFTDKQLGHTKIVPNASISKETIAIRAEKLFYNLDKNTPPDADVAVYKTAEPNGNIEMSTVCSYCPYKGKCHPWYRSFAYAGKIVDLVVVKKEPKVDEIVRAQV